MGSWRIFMVKKKTPKRPQCRQYSLHLIYFFYWGQLQGSVSVRSMKVSTNQWHNYGSVQLAIFDHLLVLIVIFSMREVAISPKYNFEKLMRKLTISDFYWLKTYRVWCIVLLMANPLKCLDEWTMKACAQSKKDLYPRNSFRWIK